MSATSSNEKPAQRNTKEMANVLIKTKQLNLNENEDVLCNDENLDMQDILEETEKLNSTLVLKNEDVLCNNENLDMQDILEKTEKLYSTLALNKPSAEEFLNDSDLLLLQTKIVRQNTKANKTFNPMTFSKHMQPHPDGQYYGDPQQQQFQQGNRQQGQAPPQQQQFQQGQVPQQQQQFQQGQAPPQQQFQQGQVPQQQQQFQQGQAPPQQQFQQGQVPQQQQQFQQGQAPPQQGQVPPKQQNNLGQVPQQPIKQADVPLSSQVPTGNVPGEQVAAAKASSLN